MKYEPECQPLTVRHHFYVPVLHRQASLWWGGGIKWTIMGPPNKAKSHLRVWGWEKTAICHAIFSTSCWKAAEKQLKSSSAPKWVVLKTLHPNRAIPQLLCAERGRGRAHTHAFLGRVFVYLCYPSPSLLPTQLLGGIRGRMMVRAGIRWLSRDMVAKQGHGGRGMT